MACQSAGGGLNHQTIDAFLHREGNDFHGNIALAFAHYACQEPHSLHNSPVATLVPKGFDASAEEQEMTMERGLLAPLSPNEQTALQRVANGISTLNHLRLDSVERLKRLALVEESDGCIRLTVLGQERCRAGRFASPGQPTVIR
jgi:hypothetical protein